MDKAALERLLESAGRDLVRVTGERDRYFRMKNESAARFGAERARRQGLEALLDQIQDVVFEKQPRRIAKIRELISESSCYD